MFKVNQSPTFSRTISIPVPVDGGHDSQTINVIYRALDDVQLESFDMLTMKGQKEFLRAIIVTMDDLVDVDNKPVTYNDSVREQIIGKSYARNPLMKGYSDAMVPALAGN